MERVWHNGRDPMEVQPGELAVYCPTCPQPGINLPEKWQEETDKYLYQRIFVADGNFKADHVRQDRAAPDMWLSPGGGMDPNQGEYEEFLRDAIERRTVSVFISLGGPLLTLRVRKHLAKTHFAPSRTLC